MKLIITIGIFVVLTSYGCYLKPKYEQKFEKITKTLEGEWNIDSLIFEINDTNGVTKYINVNAGVVKISHVSPTSNAYRFLYYAHNNLITRNRRPPNSYSHGDIWITALAEQDGGGNKFVITKDVVPDNEESNFNIGVTEIKDNQIKFDWMYYNPNSSFNDYGVMHLTRIK